MKSVLDQNTLTLWQFWSLKGLRRPMYQISIFSIVPLRFESFATVFVSLKLVKAIKFLTSRFLSDIEIKIFLLNYC